MVHGCGSSGSIKAEEGSGKRKQVVDTPEVTIGVEAGLVVVGGVGAAFAQG